ncbi:MAG: hypothetical protein CVV56_04220 [Tenericutes bacterium HGW-Tenericutes-1]|jgi:uncharacterized membrane protein|nr:MAG: hypothetical protein CVV56_04220 [Tenericutes bacterium HGW-Tenericutes-1]
MNTKEFFGNKRKVREMTLLAMFIAIIIVMGFVPYLGYITVVGTSVTLIHIPVLIGAVIMGRKGGIILGLTFGLTSFFRALTSVGLDYIFIFPWVSILPRFIFGLIIYDVYQFFLKLFKGRLLAMVVSFGLLTLIHTLMVLPLMISAFPLALNLPSVSSVVDSGGEGLLDFMRGTSSISTIMTIILSVLVSNGLIEAGLAASVGAVVADRIIAILKKEEKKEELDEGDETIASID